MVEYRVCRICGQACYKQKPGYSPFFGLEPGGWYHHDSELDELHRASPVSRDTLSRALARGRDRYYGRGGG